MIKYKTLCIYIHVQNMRVKYECNIYIMIFNINYTLNVDLHCHNNQSYILIHLSYKQLWPFSYKTVDLVTFLIHFF